MTARTPVVDRVRRPGARDQPAPVGSASVIVSHSARVLFVHVQKTGGSTVDRLLTEHLPDAEPVRGLPDGRHARLGAALRAHPELADYWIFGFVRNPWARLWSWHSMILRRGEAAAAGNAEVAAYIARTKFWGRVLRDFPDFETFVLDGTRELRRLGTPQIQFLSYQDRQADFIGRTERLDEDVRSILDRWGLEAPPSIPRRNAGPSRDYREQYTPAMRARVAEVFARDIELFDYEF